MIHGIKFSYRHLNPHDKNAKKRKKNNKELRFDKPGQLTVANEELNARINKKI